MSNGVRISPAIDGLLLPTKQRIWHPPEPLVGMHEP
jgi:hypothetical protein